MVNERALQSALLLGIPGLEHGFERDRALAPTWIWRPHQVHGAVIVECREAGADPVDADAVLFRDPGCAGGVAAADCVPLLLARADGSAAAAVHAGWRGIAAGVVETALRALAAGHSSGRRDIVAAIGPAAGGCCYEVGPEVVAALAPSAARVRPSSHRDRHLLDLRGVVSDRVRLAGVRDGAIEFVGPCTICSSDWPSYRRLGDAAGRLVAWIALGPRARGRARDRP